MAVITIVHGRGDHLRRQREGLVRSVLVPAVHVVVAMDDPAMDLSASPSRSSASRSDVVVHVPRDERGLPLAAARNRGASEAVARGAGLLVFLDVDCIPAPALVGAYADAADLHGGDLLCGPVAYLDPAGPGGYDLDHLGDGATFHEARPVPAPGEVLRGQDDHELFWSLSFAVTAQTWRAVGGFDEAYAGYGGEDTDYAMRARAAGVPVTWVGGARAFHQYHPVSRPPVEHVDDIVRNATIFWQRWGWWPMGGWLAAFEERGLVRWVDGRLERVGVCASASG